MIVRPCKKSFSPRAQVWGAPSIFTPDSIKRRIDAEESSGRFRGGALTPRAARPVRRSQTHITHDRVFYGSGPAGRSTAAPRESRFARSHLKKLAVRISRISKRTSVQQRGLPSFHRAARRSRARTESLRLFAGSRPSSLGFPTARLLTPMPRLSKRAAQARSAAQGARNSGSKRPRVQQDPERHAMQHQVQ